MRMVGLCGGEESLEGGRSIQRIARRVLCLWLFLVELEEEEEESRLVVSLASCTASSRVGATINTLLFFMRVGQASCECWSEVGKGFARSGWCD